MTPIPVNLAIEDELSEVVLRRLLAHAERGYAVGNAYGRSGYGYLKRTISGWNRAARSIPFVVLTDLDDNDCAATLIENWLTEPRHPNLIFRVAVREVESWLLAGKSELAKFLQCPERTIPDRPDALSDPKRSLVESARASRSAAIRSRLVPKKGSTAKQGPDYNACLGAFVRTHWVIGAAAANSPSLARAVRRFHAFDPAWR